MNYLEATYQDALCSTLNVINWLCEVQDLQHQSMIENVFREADTNSSGFLDRAEVLIAKNIMLFVKFICCACCSG